MKTAQRILATSLELFNEHGESSVTSVDIANELDISPGNLYYHFKGKEIIIDALFELHTQQFDAILSADSAAELSIEEQFYYFYVILEKIHLYRFLYRSPMDLVEKYPSVAKGTSKLVKRLESTLSALFLAAREREQLRFDAAEHTSLVELTSMVMIQSTQYQQLKQRSDDHNQIYNALAQLLTLLMPRLQVSVENLNQLQQSIALHAFTRNDE